MGVNGPGRAAATGASGRPVAMAVTADAVKVQELDTGLLKALEHKRGDALDHLVTEHRILVDPGPQANAVHGQRLHEFDGVGVEPP
jgi:hypothetical protein